MRIANKHKEKGDMSSESRRKGLEGAWKHRRGEILMGFILLLATLAMFRELQSFEFVNLDDGPYVYENSQVLGGWSLEGLKWAFTTTLHGHWHPITWLSHMTDCQFFGSAPGPHHLMNLFFHLANTLLLFSVMNRMTGALLRSAFVAALFALHPLHVEAVAWVSSRKDLLSTFFWLLTILAYVLYSQKPGVMRYVAALAFFALGLMAKSMVVTLPIVLLLFDYWPLGRIAKVPSNPAGSLSCSHIPCLVIEKIPFLVLAVISSAVSFLSMKSDHPIYHPRYSFNTSGLETKSSHVADALISYWIYVRKMIWPVDLVTPYMESGMIPWWETTGAALFLVITVVLVFMLRKRYPYFLTGWMFYLITLLPVIGFVRSGPHLMADRYTYVPLVGLFVIVAWCGRSEAAPPRHRAGSFVAVLSGVVLIILGYCTHRQLQYWRDGATLHSHTLSLMPNHPEANNNLGAALALQGKNQEAIRHFERALELKPRCRQALNNLGRFLVLENRSDEAIQHLQKALAGGLEHPQTHYNLSMALASSGRTEEASRHLESALSLKPDFAEAYNYLGVILISERKTEEAIEHFEKALAIKPNYHEAHNNLGGALLSVGKRDEAARHFQEVLRIKPNDGNAAANLSMCQFKE